MTDPHKDDENGLDADSQHCYGDGGAADYGGDGHPKILKHKQWSDPQQEPFAHEREAYQGLVWQCRYSGIEVPDDLWSHTEMGKGKPYADDQASDMAEEPQALAAFDA